MAEYFGSLVSKFLSKPQGEHGANAEHHIIIPRYQRPYRWSPDLACRMLEDAWESVPDLVHEAENARRSHKSKSKSTTPDIYLGAIITFNNNGEFEIVDGQQRIVTFTLLIAVIIWVSEKSELILKKRSGDRFVLKHIDYNCLGFGVKFMPRIKNSNTALNHSWLKIFREDEDIWDLPNLSDIQQDSSTYSKNFCALHDMLVSNLQTLPVNDRHIHLECLARYIAGNFRATIIRAPSASTARQAFRVANYRGQPFDVIDYAKSTFHDILAGDEDQQIELCDAFEQSALKRNSETAFLTAVRAWTQCVDVPSLDNPDGIVKAMKDGPNSLTSPGSQVDAANFCTRALTLHLSMQAAQDFSLSNPSDSFELRRSLSNLFALESAGRNSRESDDEVETDDVYTLWRSVTVCILHVLNVDDIATATCMTPCHKLANNAFEALERVQLVFMRPSEPYKSFSEKSRQVELRNRLTEILTIIWKFDRKTVTDTTQIQDFCSKILINERERKLVSDSIRFGVFYGSNISLAKTGCRHLISRLNTIFWSDAHRSQIMPSQDQCEYITIDFS